MPIPTCGPMPLNPDGKPIPPNPETAKTRHNGAGVKGTTLPRQRHWANYFASSAILLKARVKPLSAIGRRTASPPPLGVAVTVIVLACPNASVATFGKLTGTRQPPGS